MRSDSQSGQRLPWRRTAAGSSGRHPAPLAATCLLLPAAILLPLTALAQTTQPLSAPGSSNELPDSPHPSAAHPPHPANPCPAQNHTVGASQTTPPAGPSASDPSQKLLAVAPAPCTNSKPNWYMRFADGPKDLPLTPMDKGWLAARNVVDPINAIAILGTSAIVVGSNPYSPYGPGMAGFARNVGVAYSQDMTGEFFGTFVIPSIFHQNPHYRRLPHATFYRRLLNTCTQVLWGYSDSGHGMPNYANILGFAIDDEIGNLYVPGRDTDLESSARRYAFTFVLVPTDNLVSEFLPDVAHRVNTHYVFIQRIINAVAGPDMRGAP